MASEKERKKNNDFYVARKNKLDNTDTPLTYERRNGIPSDHTTNTNSTV